MEGVEGVESRILTLSSAPAILALQPLWNDRVTRAGWGIRKLYILVKIFREWCITECTAPW